MKKKIKYNFQGSKSVSHFFVFITAVKHDIKIGIGHIIFQDKNSFTANLTFFNVQTTL